ncbi:MULTISPECIES: hypothetical protein [Mesorhizobium]|nr:MULTISPECIES: hypothetical protein [Mesorhizobium]
MSVNDEQLKTRLTSKAQIAQAVLKLAESGTPFDEWLTALTNSFYVDLDAFSEIMGLPTIDFEHLVPEL